MKWLVVSNCQTLGLTRCLQLLNAEITFSACDVWELQKQKDTLPAALSSYDKIVLNPECEAFGVDFSHLENVVRLPTIAFGGFHPDMCLLWDGPTLVNGALGPCHSIVAFAAWRRG